MNIKYFKGTNSFMIFYKYKSFFSKALKDLNNDNSNILVIREKNDNLINNLFNFINTPPFLAKEKYIFFFNILKNIDKKTQEKIIDLISKNNIDYINMFFFEEIEEERKNEYEKNPLIKFLNKYLISEFNNLSDVQLNIWITNVLKKYNYSIDDDAIFLLKQITNSDLWAIKNAIDKLILYKNDDKNINKNDIKEIVFGNFKAEIFDLNDYIIKRNKSNAYKILKNLIHLEEEPISIIKNLQYVFKNLYLIKKFYNDENILINTFNIHPFVIKKYSQYINKYNSDELINLYELCIDAEVNIRSGNSNDEYLDIIKVIHYI